MTDHPSLQTLVAYVMDALPAHEVNALEKHVANCEVCAEALCREAQLEEQLHRVGTQVRAQPGASLAPRRRRLAIATMLAAAAGLALWLRPPPDPVDVAKPQLSRRLPPLGICQRRPDFCEHPERHGIATVGTAGLEMPRYEEGPPLISWHAKEQPQSNRSAQ